MKKRIAALLFAVFLITLAPVPALAPSLTFRVMGNQTNLGI